jgi:hypothetical protein
MMPRLRQIIYALTLIGAVSALGFIAYAGRSFHSLLSGFSAWALSPYAVFALAGVAVRLQWVAAVVLVSSLVATVYAAAAYADAFFIHLHSTNGIIFIFLPFYQLILAAVVLLLSLISRFVRPIPTI